MTSLMLSSAVSVALLGLCLVIVARTKRAGARGARRQGLEVVDRVSLGPKQGVAAIRVAGRVVLVSHGEGGVRRLFDLPAESWDADRTDPSLTLEVLAPTEVEALGTVARRRSVAARITRFKRRTRLWPAVAVCATMLLPAVAEATPPEASMFASAAAFQEADADGDDGILGALPQMMARPDGETELQFSGPMGTALLLGAMTLLPTLLLLATGFTRILIVLHLLKQALGAQAVPPTHLVNALALLLTLFLMTPTLDRASQEAIDPWLEGEITQAQMFKQVVVPFRDFMLDYVGEEDLARFIEFRGDKIPSRIEDVKLTTLMAAFTTSELRRAFQLGFVLFLPFIVIDLVVASVLMSMGMFMLPPVMISLPFKLLIFVLADGWSLVVNGLLSSFG